MYIDFLRNINLWVGAIRASSQTFKRTIQIVTDSGNVFLALFVAMILKYETLNFLNSIDFYVGFITILFPTIYIFAYLGLYRAFVRFASIEIVFPFGDAKAIGNEYSPMLDPMSMKLES